MMKELAKVGEVARSNPNILMGVDRDQPGRELARADDPKKFFAAVIGAVTILFESGTFKNAPKNVDAAAQAWNVILFGRIPLKFITPTTEHFLRRGGWAPSPQEFADHAEFLIRQERIDAINKELTIEAEKEREESDRKTRNEMISLGLDPDNRKDLRSYVLGKMKPEAREYFSAVLGEKQSA